MGCGAHGAGGEPEAAAGAGGTRATGGAVATGGATVGTPSGGGGGGVASDGVAPSGGGVARGGNIAVGGGAAAAGSGGGGAGTPAVPADALGAYPVASSAPTRGGTMTFTNVGAPGWWPRRLERPAGDPACDVKDGTGTWGGRCCLESHETTSERLSPFDEELTLIVKALHVRQLAVYQPGASAAEWSRVSAYDERRAAPENLWFTQQGDGAPSFPGDLTHSDCVEYLSQEPRVECSELEYQCPNDPGMLHRGWSGSKLIVMLGSMTFGDAGVAACSGDGAGHPGPWVALVASELVRDGARKWDGLCNCYSRTGSVGDGCGEINLFEVVLDQNAEARGCGLGEFMSTGLRSYQAGHVGGSVCGAGCTRDGFAADADVVDACAEVAYARGPVLEVGGATDGCPVWRRPEGDRYFVILLDETTRTIQIAVLHPERLPEVTRPLLPELPGSLPRSMVDGLVALRLPS